MLLSECSVMTCVRTQPWVTVFPAYYNTKKHLVCGSSGHCRHGNSRRRLFTFCVCKLDPILVALPAQSFTRLLSEIGFPFLRPFLSYVHSPVFCFCFFTTVFCYRPDFLWSEHFSLQRASLRTVKRGQQVHTKGLLGCRSYWS